MRRLELLFLVLCTLAVVTRPANAEVMDKLPSVAAIWVSCLGGAVVIFAVCRFLHWSLIAASLAVALLYTIFVVVESYELGAENLREAGPFYLASTYITLALIWAGAIAGFYLRRKRSQSGKTPG